MTTNIKCTTSLDLEIWWPDLFGDLDCDQRARVVHAWAAQWHEGWEPNRADVALTVEYVAGRLSGEEYRRRVITGIPSPVVA